MIKFVFSLIVNIFKLIDVGLVVPLLILYLIISWVSLEYKLYAAVMDNYVILDVTGTRVW